MFGIRGKGRVWRAENWIWILWFMVCMRQSEFGSMTVFTKRQTEKLSYGWLNRPNNSTMWPGYIWRGCYFDSHDNTGAIQYRSRRVISTFHRFSIAVFRKKGKNRTAIEDHRPPTTPTSFTFRLYTPMDSDWAVWIFCLVHAKCSANI